MKITYKLYSTLEKIREVCHRSDIQKIHNDGQMRWCYRLPGCIHFLCVAYHKGKPVAVGMNVKETKYNLQLTVLPEYYRKGIGREIVRLLLPTFGKSDFPYNSHRIRVYKDEFNRDFWNSVLKENNMCLHSDVVYVNVRGVNRKIHLETDVVDGKARARTYVKSKTVSGVYQEYRNGTVRFTPKGANANLV